jgi:hypothetical protein
LLSVTPLICLRRILSAALSTGELGDRRFRISKICLQALLRVGRTVFVKLLVSSKLTVLRFEGIKTDLFAIL